MAAHDPEWTQLEQAVGPPPPLPDDMEARVKYFDGVLIQMSKALPPTDPGIETRDEAINEDVTVRIYTPPPSNENDKSLPLLVFLHGGGWQAGNLDTEDHICRTVCSEAHCVVVSVAYRLGPYVKFPTPIDDSYYAYCWAQNNASRLGADPSRCHLWGGSAGGGLAIAVAYRLVQRGEPLAGLILMQPMCLHPDDVPEKYKHLHKSYVENADAKIVSSKNAMQAFVDLQARGEAAWFPCSSGAEGVKGFPRTYIVNTDLECLRDDGTVLEAELKDAGVSVRRDVIEGFPHYYWCFPVVEGGKLFRRKLVEGIRWVVDGA